MESLRSSLSGQSSMSKNFSFSSPPPHKKWRIVFLPLMFLRCNDVFRVFACSLHHCSLSVFFCISVSGL